MVIEKYINAGKFRHTSDALAHWPNDRGQTGRPSALIVEADRTVSVCTNGKEHPLGISPPRDLNGGTLVIAVENIPPPAIADIRRAGGREVHHGEILSPEELASLVYVSKHSAIPGAPLAFAYSVSSASGEHGSQTLRFSLIQDYTTTILQAPDRM